MGGAGTRSGADNGCRGGQLQRVQQCLEVSGAGSCRVPQSHFLDERDNLATDVLNPARSIAPPGAFSVQRTEQGDAGKEV